jgi:hypothetical protein
MGRLLQEDRPAAAPGPEQLIEPTLPDDQLLR